MRFTLPLTLPLLIFLLAQPIVAIRPDGVPDRVELGGRSLFATNPLRTYTIYYGGDAPNRSFEIDTSLRFSVVAATPRISVYFIDTPMTSGGDPDLGTGWFFKLWLYHADTDTPVESVGSDGYIGAFTNGSALSGFPILSAKPYELRLRIHIPPHLNMTTYVVILNIMDVSQVNATGGNDTGAGSGEPGVDSIAFKTQILPTLSYIVQGNVYTPDRGLSPHTLVTVTNLRTKEKVTCWTTQEGFYRVNILANTGFTDAKDGDQFKVSAERGNAEGENMSTIELKEFSLGEYRSVVDVYMTEEEVPTGLSPYILVGIFGVVGVLFIVLYFRATGVPSADGEPAAKTKAKIELTKNRSPARGQATTKGQRLPPASGGGCKDGRGPPTWDAPMDGGKAEGKKNRST